MTLYRAFGWSNSPDVHRARLRMSKAAAKNHDREQACRQRCRALLLIIRAKLEAVESGMTTLESEFLANILLPDGGTVGQWLSPASLESSASPSRHW